MKGTSRDSVEESLSLHSTSRRPFLRALAAAGAVGAFGLPTFTRPVNAGITGVSIEFKRCKVAFVTKASSVGALYVYYADTDGQRQSRMSVDPMPADARAYSPLVVEYDEEDDRTQIQLAEPKGALVCIAAQSNGAYTTARNPTSDCVPDGFNTAPAASFTVSDDPTVDELVTFTSTAQDDDLPDDRLHYAWDLDGDGTYESSGPEVTTTYDTVGPVTVSLLVTDDCGESDSATETITVESATPPLAEEAAQVESVQTGTSGFFGRAVSLSGDSLLVGASGLDVVASNRGGAYVFVRDAFGAWTQQATLLPDVIQVNYFAGRAVSLDGDTAIIGANEDDQVAENAGAAYVFARSGTSWSRQAKLVPSDGQRFDRFGSSLSVDGDTALVASPFKDEGGKQVGAAYVFVRDGTGAWSQQAKLLAPNGEIESFGSSVSLSGDTALVGARDADDGATANTGAGYVFTRSGSSWTFQERLVASDAEQSDRLGRTVSLDGDTAILGSYTSAQYVGKAYVFTRDASGVWSQQAKLFAPDGESGDSFGRALSIDGDNVLVGAPGVDLDGVDNAGGIYWFARSGTVWEAKELLVESDPSQNSGLGTTVSIDGTTVVGGHESSGDSVYVYELD